MDQVHVDRHQRAVVLLGVNANVVVCNERTDRSGERAARRVKIVNGAKPIAQRQHNATNDVPCGRPKRRRRQQQQQARSCARNATQAN